jgi:hypothetical protein
MCRASGGQEYPTQIGIILAETSFEKVFGFWAKARMDGFVPWRSRPKRQLHVRAMMSKARGVNSCT